MSDRDFRFFVMTYCRKGLHPKGYSGECRECRADSKARYDRSEKGRAREARYEQSEKGRKTRSDWYYNMPTIKRIARALRDRRYKALRRQQLRHADADTQRAPLAAYVRAGLDAHVSLTKIADATGLTKGKGITPT